MQYNQRTIDVRFHRRMKEYRNEPIANVIPKPNVKQSIASLKQQCQNRKLGQTWLEGFLNTFLEADSLVISGFGIPADRTVSCRSRSDV